MHQEWALVFILGLSIALQLLAAVLSLRLIPVSRGRVAWILVSSALILMAMRRSLPFYRLVAGQVGKPPDLWGELIALVISMLLVAGMFAIGPLFRERERAEQKLREARKAWEDVFQAIGHPALVLDSRQRILEANKAAQEKFGVAATDAGRHYSELVCGKTAPPGDCPAQRALLFGGSGSTQAEMETPRGVFLVSCTPFRDEHGSLPKVIFIATDITERKRLEEKLRHSEKMEAIGQLAGGVAHDFNNQLTSMMGYAELLESRLEDPELKSHAQNIVTAATRAADLTRELLAFARKGKYLSVTVDVHEVIEEVALLLSRSIDRKISIHRSLRARPSLVTGDPTQLQSALLNLAINARDAMPGGGVLEFSTEVTMLGEQQSLVASGELAPGRYLRIRVADNGVGMDDETRRHLFEPFFTTKERGKGTGMGLASVFGAMKAHGGAVSVKSAPGKGTTASLYLPVAARTASGAPLEFSRPVRGVGRIVVVDDEQEVRELLFATLRGLGYEVVLCADGADCVELYREAQDRFDLVILDMVMPRMSGKETFISLRRLDPGIRVLLCSGHSLDGEAQALIDQGALGFLQKPFRTAELSRQVAAALALSGSADGSDVAVEEV